MKKKRTDTKKASAKDNGKQAGNSIQIRPETAAWILGGFSLLLVLVSITGQYLRYFTVYDRAFGLIPLVDVDRELTIPTMYSVMLLFMAAALLAVIASFKRKNKERFFWNWVVLAAGFLFMSFDEGSQIHELTVMPIRRAVGDALPGAFTFAWVIPGAILVLIIGLFFLKFLIKLPKRTRRLTLLSAGLYLAGALALEMVGGNFVKQYGSIDYFSYNVIVTIEESFEFAGLVLFVYTLLDYIREKYGEVHTRFGKM